MADGIQTATLVGSNMSAIEDTAVSAAAKPTTNPNANACSATGSKLRKEKDLKCSVCGVSEAKSKKGSWIYDEEDDRVGAYCIQLAVGDTTGKHSDATSSSSSSRNNSSVSP